MGIQNLAKQKKILEQAPYLSPEEEIDNKASELEQISSEDCLDFDSEKDLEGSEDENDDSHYLRASEEVPVAVTSNLMNDNTVSNEEDDTSVPVEGDGTSIHDEEAEEQAPKYEIPDCSLREASLCFGETASEDERLRLVSQSDANVDIRNLIMGRDFVLCLCDNFDCECEGEVHFTKSLGGETGVVEHLYMDPLSDFQSDLKPKLIFTKTGWKAKE